MQRGKLVIEALDVLTLSENSCFFSGMPKKTDCVLFRTLSGTRGGGCGGSSSPCMG